MDSWLIALIVIAILIIIALILLAIFAAPSYDQVEHNKTPTIDLDKFRSQKQHTANLTIAFINLSNQTSNFLQQAKYGYKGIGETYNDMDNLAKYIGHCLHAISDKHGPDMALLLCEKNELYKELTEDVLVNKRVIKGNDRLLKHLNEKNAKLADILHDVCGKNDRKQYITMLHKYDVLIVSQMGALAKSDHKRYLISHRDSQKLCLTTALVLSSCSG